MGFWTNHSLFDRLLKLLLVAFKTVLFTYKYCSVKVKFLMSCNSKPINISISPIHLVFIHSGLLLTYHTLKHLKKTKGRMNWAIFYFHRVWRITPTYMISLAIFASLAIHFGTGPTKNSLFEYVGKTCQDYWWTNLLYINNLYPFPGTLNAQVKMQTFPWQHLEIPVAKSSYD